MNICSQKTQVQTFTKAQVISNWKAVLGGLFSEVLICRRHYRAVSSKPLLLGFCGAVSSSEMMVSGQTVSSSDPVSSDSLWLWLSFYAVWREDSFLPLAHMPDREETSALLPSKEGTGQTLGLPLSISSLTHSPLPGRGRVDDLTHEARSTWNPQDFVYQGGGHGINSSRGRVSRCISLLAHIPSFWVLFAPLTPAPNSTFPLPGDPVFSSSSVWDWQANLSWGMR